MKILKIREFLIKFSRISKNCGKMWYFMFHSESLTLMTVGGFEKELTKTK